MNIFVLSDKIQESARFHVDKHVVKMPTELVQMLSFTYHNKNLWDNKIPESIMSYNKSHDKHPCTLWLRESLSNWMWGIEFGYALLNEYYYRYNNKNKHLRTKAILDFASKNPPIIKDFGLTRFAEAMPEDYKVLDSVIDNYRLYYCLDKRHLFKWTKRDIPEWTN